jgi:acyl-lipid omega-6 desaturase (Delta-12 desaturase)
VSRGSASSWRDVVDRYTEPRLGRSMLDLATSVLPYLGLFAAIFFAQRVSFALALLLVLPASGFLIRVFIVFHDCSHGSFMATRRANNMVGATLGLLVWLPFRSWQHEHAVHHATSGDLDRRGIGDITTLTVSEYAAMSPLSRLGYRLFRNPILMFGLGWLVVLLLKPRLVPRGARRCIRNSVLGTNLVIAIVVGVLCLTLGWREYLLVQGPIFAVSGAAGIWLFYVQHQFEGTYWQNHASWRYDHAALQGSSYLKLPTVLQFFTGNIGFHHIHHLSVRIPNYNLQNAHDQATRLNPVPELTLRDGLRATRLKLWDEHRKALVTFRDARRAKSEEPPPDRGPVI